MKKILWITSSFPVNEQDDSVVPWMTELVTRLSKEYKINLLTADYKHSGSNSYKGIPVSRFRYWFKNGEDLTNLNGLNNQIGKPWLWPKILSWFLNGWIAVHERLYYTKYDYVVVNWAIPHLFWVPKCKEYTFYPYKIITKEYGSTAYKLSKLFKGYILKKSDVLVAISNYVKKAYDDKAVYIPELQKITIAPVFDKPKRERTKILFVGRLVERKGVEYLIQAMQKVKNVNLYIIGDGELRPRLKRLAKDICDYNSTNRINFLGKVDEETLKIYYLESDIFVLPSIIDRKGNTEGQGIVILEAIHAGTPVIATNVGGIPDMIKDHITGLLVPEKDSNSLYKALQFMIDNPDTAKQYAKAAYEDVQERFNWDAVMGQWREILN